MNVSFPCGCEADIQFHYSPRAEGKEFVLNRLALTFQSDSICEAHKRLALEEAILKDLTALFDA